MSDMKRTITPNDPADFTPTREPQIPLQPFRYWCQKILPLVYDDSLSYYELLCKVVDYLNKTMEDVSNMDTDVANLLNAYNQLQGYVNNYFSSLDVQQEINNKLDEMVTDGTFEEIVDNYLKPFTTSIGRINIKEFGCKVDGVTDDSDSLQNIFDTYVGYEIFCTDGIMVLNKSITLPENTKCNLKCNITTTNNLLEYFFLIKSNSDISINFNNALAISDYNYMKALKINSLSNTIIHDCNCYGCSCFIFADNIKINNLRIFNNSLTNKRSEIYMVSITGSKLYITNNKFIGKKGWTTPFIHTGEIRISGGFNGIGSVYRDRDTITNSIYETQYYQDVYITNNFCENCNSRYIYLCNIVNAITKNNLHNGTIGEVTDALSSDDLYIVEFCRNFNISDNSSLASGQNGIDILASKNGVVNNNNMTNCYAVGLMFDIADTQRETKVSSDFRLYYQYSSDIVANNNILHSAETCVEIRIAQNVALSNNDLRINTEFSLAHNHFAINTSTLTDLFQSNDIKISNIHNKNNIVDTNTAHLFMAGLQFILWGTITLGKTMAAVSDWIDVNQYDIKVWEHDLGNYENVELYFYIDPEKYTTYNITPNMVMNNRIKIDNWWLEAQPGSGSEIRNLLHGCNVSGTTPNSVIFECGAYITSIKNRTSGNWINIGLETSGKVQVVMY